MDLSIAKKNSAKVVFQRWCYKESMELERQKQKMKEERYRFDQERRTFEREKQEFSLRQKSEMGQWEQEKHLFEMKWKILEEELRKLAIEKEHFERQRDFYRMVDEHEKAARNAAGIPRITGEPFFAGVSDEMELKKRYKDLIKIYHPDNVAGDTEALQEINREYDKLQELYR
jgi:hypothetical protein